MKRHTFITLPLLILVTVTLTAAQPRDVSGSKDHPLISRYPGSYIAKYEAAAFDEVILPLGKLDNQRKPEKSQPLEGKVTRIEYWAPKGRSILEVFRNYEMALQRAGFQTLFTCANEACGYTGQPRLWGGRIEHWVNNPSGRHLAAKLSRSEGDAYVSLHIQGADQPNIVLYVIETKPMESGLVKVDAAALAGDLAQTGHVATYGIYFDFDKAEVKPESEPTLREIATLLQQNLPLKLHIVGHTDNVGDFAHNMDLSRRRAQAVVQVLTTKYRIAAERLRGDGVGPLAPVASNDADEGRAKNRRVELVKQ